MKIIIAINGLAMLFLSGCNITIEPPKGNIQVSQNGNTTTVSQGNSNNLPVNNLPKPTAEKPKEVVEKPKEDNSNKDFRDVKVQVPRLDGEIPKNLKICVHQQLPVGASGSPCFTPEEFSTQFTETPPFDKGKGIITVRIDRNLLALDVWCVIIEDEIETHITGVAEIKGKDTKTSYVLEEWQKNG